MFRLFIYNKHAFIGRLRIYYFLTISKLIELFFTKQGYQPNKTGNYFTEKMDKGYEKERFETLKIKASVVDKFRRFCKTMSKSQSMALLSMIDFFEIKWYFAQRNYGSSHANFGKTF